MEALSRALERKRTFYNALFAEARQRSTELEPGDLLEHLGSRVAPIMEALPAMASESEDRVLDVLYRSSLDLLQRGLAGRRARGSINAVWEQLLPRVTPLLAVAPRRVVASLSNAAFNLDQTPGARPAEWLHAMVAGSEHCPDLESLNAAGQVAAWRAGLPQYRSVALAHCARLREALVRALFGTGERSVPLGELTQNRFGSTGPEPRLTLLARLGGFTGYGGQFVAPPRLTRLDGALIAFDEQSAWEIHADAFGALLRRRNTLPVSPQPSAPREFELSSTGRVRWGGLEAVFPDFADAPSAACDGELLAVVPARSHYVYLVAAMRGRA